MHIILYVLVGLSIGFPAGGLIIYYELQRRGKLKPNEQGGDGQYEDGD
jgi:hypothetical protein